MPGHWEGDLLSGSKNSYIATLVERHSRYVMLMKLTNKEIVRHLPTLPVAATQSRQVSYNP